MHGSNINLAEQQCNEEQKPTGLAETIKNDNNMETTIFYKCIPKYTEEKINIQLREASLNAFGNTEHSTEATWHVFSPTKRTKEWLAFQAGLQRDE